MEGSSESGWQRSESSRGLNSSFSTRNPRILRARTAMSFEGNTSHDSELVSTMKGRARAPWPQFSSQRDQIMGCDGGVEGFGSAVRAVETNKVSLRQWLDNPERRVDALECVHIFSQIVNIVNLAHAEGIIVQNLRPSCFVMSTLNRVSFIESAFSSDSEEHGSHSPVADSIGDPSFPLLHKLFSDKSLGNERTVLDLIYSETDVVEGSGNDPMVEKKLHFPMKRILLSESNWYMPPEDVSSAPPGAASDVYQLGVLLFELFCTSSSMEEKNSTMANLRHRVLSPQLLLKWPKEASFCMWLLHPEPSCRPKMNEILQSDFLNEPRSEIEEREAAIQLREKIEDQELVLQFLMLLQQKKQDVANSLKETISLMSSDIEDVSKLLAALPKKAEARDCTENYESGSSCSRKRSRERADNSNADELSDEEDESYRAEDTPSGQQEGILSRCPRLMSNFRKLESAYFMARRRVANPSSKLYNQTSNDGRGFGLAAERSSISNKSSKEKYNEQRQSGWLNTFLEGLCKYLTYSQLKVKADLNQGDLLNCSNLVCALGFDRDGEFFATAGVNKKIKVFEYNSIANRVRDIHYPVVEMSSRSKLSSICWNGYIKSHIASSNFDGVVQVWDVTRSCSFLEMREHEKRIWSVDFSVADPMMLASGSDDGSVKLWNINQGVSVSTIQTKANICCVQFPTDSSRTIAFGSADHKIYYYDLRNSRQPLFTLVGHSKTVSYVKFVDSTTLVSASTDNTLKLWDLSMATSGRLDSSLQSYTGHLNMKNFVGLSVSDGYIATGSETNEVFVYHKAFPMPALSFKFADSLSSNEAVDNSAVFISSLCWRGNSPTLAAANSMGNIKLLEMA